MEKKLPLISVAFLSYNQEEFVFEALNSILGQDYPNVEVIISDDASTDRSSKIIEELCATYSGPFNVKVFNNSVNQGIAKNVNKVLSRCSGNYVALAAGDDISSKSRLTDSLNFLENNAAVSAIFTNLAKIDRNGYNLGLYFNKEPILCKNISDFMRRRKVWAIGASLFFNRSVFSKYGNFLAGTYQEDGSLAFRAILSGEFRFVDKPLVSYRFHGNNASQGLSVSEKAQFKIAELRLVDSMMKDYLLSDIVNERVFWEIVRRKALVNLSLFIFKSKTASSLVFSISRMVRKIKAIRFKQW